MTLRRRKHYLYLAVASLVILVSLTILAIERYRAPEFKWPWEIALLKLDAEKGDANSASSLYHYYSATGGPERDIQAWLERGAALGDMELQFMLASRLDKDNSEEAVCWYYAAATQDHLESAFRVGKKLTVVGTIQEAESWLAYAAGNGHPVAALELGKLIDETDGDSLAYSLELVRITSDKSKATSVYGKAAAKREKELMVKVQSENIDASDLELYRREARSNLDRSAESVPSLPSDWTQSCQNQTRKRKS